MPGEKPAPHEKHSRRHAEGGLGRGGTIVRSVFHQFSPWGVTGVVVITESHVTVHTWPEHGYAAVDVFSCSPRLDHARIREELRMVLGAREVRRRSFARGRV